VPTLVHMLSSEAVGVEQVSWAKRQVLELEAEIWRYLTMLERDYFTRPQKSDSMGPVPAASPTSLLSAAESVSSIT
jgi:hypothetical protein